MATWQQSVVANAATLVSDGTPLPEIVQRLRKSGLGLGESIAALVAAGVSQGVARSAVTQSETWADLRDGSEAPERREWIELEGRVTPQRAAELVALCEAQKKILELWVAARRHSPPGREEREVVVVAVVVDEDMEYRRRAFDTLISSVFRSTRKLDSEHWWFLPHKISDTEIERHGRRLYGRPEHDDPTKLSDTEHLGGDSGGT